MRRSAEVSQVLANLGVGDTEQFAELRAAGSIAAAADELLQLAQIKTQTVDDRLGYGTLRADFLGLVFAFGHAAIRIRPDSENEPTQLF